MHHVNFHRKTSQRCSPAALHGCSMLLVEASGTVIDCKNGERSGGFSLLLQRPEGFLKQASSDSMPCEGRSTVQIVDKGQGAAPDGYETKKLFALRILGDENNIALADFAACPFIPDIAMQSFPHIVGRQDGAIALGPAICLQMGNGREV
jgi:hypothetical protein